MPFKSAKQEYFMKIKKPDIWKEWVAKYGHHPDYAKEEKKRTAKLRKKKRRKQ